MTSQVREGSWAWLTICERYLPNLSEVIRPLNHLLKIDVAWIWDTTQVGAFNKVKQLISTEPNLAFYDVNKPMIVSADASSFDWVVYYYNTM